MSAPSSLSLLSHFANLPDPRVERTKHHRLLDIVAIAICAVIGGADDWVAVEAFGKAKFDWLKRFLELPNGIPSHDTFGRVFARIDPEAFAACFRSWVAALCDCLGLEQVAIDGKALRRSHDKGKGKAALHLVSAWACASQLTLAQQATDAKSNEITAIPKLLELLDLHGALVSIDAMGCQKDIARQIREQGGDYLLAVKDNQPHLHQDIEAFFFAGLDDDFADVTYAYAFSEEVGHGREEERGCWVFNASDVPIRDADLWLDLRTVGVVVSERALADKSSAEVRCYISSRVLDAKEFAAGVRDHWGIENGCHWVLDVAFDEDRSRVRKDHAPENLALLRRLALSLLKRAQGVKCGVKNRRLTAGWDTTFLERVLLGFDLV